jgi:organic hydroperoxide reductase OsmC/OhrA
MATTRARVFEYAVSLDEHWKATSDRGGDVLPHDEDAWTPEHLLLVALARCSLTSLVYHARRAGLTARGTASANGTVTARPEDGRFAFVAIEVVVDIALEPRPELAGVRALLASAERDCFVGASLALAPRYRWTLDGEELG